MQVRPESLCGEKCQVVHQKPAPPLETLRSGDHPVIVDTIARMPSTKDTRVEEPDFAYISCDYCDVKTENWETEKHSICDTCQSSTIVWEYSQTPRLLRIFIQSTGISSHSHYG